MLGDSFQPKSLPVHLQGVMSEGWQSGTSHCMLTAAQDVPVPCDSQMIPCRIFSPLFACRGGISFDFWQNADESRVLLLGIIDYSCTLG